MNFESLERGIRDVIESGQLGTSVALRIHAVCSSSGADLLEAVGQFGPLISHFADNSGGQVRASQHVSGRQLSVLWTSANGRTVMLTLTSVPSEKSSLQVLLIGNHGIAKLNGGNLWEEPNTPLKPGLWSREISQSIKTGTSISVSAS